jgi:CDP-diacylglycerol pyrophosphatase
MKRWKTLLLIILVIVVLAGVYGTLLIRRGFSTAQEPSALEKVIARTVRNLSIPSSARKETESDPESSSRGSRSFSGPLCRLPGQRR